MTKHADQLRHQAATHGPEEPPETQADTDAHELCQRWAAWVQTRKFFGPPPVTTNTLGRLQQRREAVTVSTGPDAECSASLMALHCAITGKEMDASRQVFELYYRFRVRNVKLAAHELGISRAAWYRRLATFRATVVAESARIVQDQAAQRSATRATTATDPEED